MDKATEELLNKLHGTVAKNLIKEFEEADEDLGVPAAIYGQAIKFLNDNKITTTIETDVNIDKLQKTLENKTKRGRLMAVTPITAAKQETK